MTGRLLLPLLVLALDSQAKPEIRRVAGVTFDWKVVRIEVLRRSSQAVQREALWTIVQKSRWPK